ncbi:hypothetical protein ACEN2T_29730 [Pseudomonas sp. W22_MBD1_FP4]|uniref:hypothetical protein n=1 Tax=Pseudomonas sp. W22_MBD1_FP4 TaxID=3240272 RepID=UPI003F949049
MNSSAVGASVEGDGLELKCRKFTLHQPKRNKDLNLLIYPFKLSIFGYATVKKEFSKSETLVNKTSGCNVGDSIHGEAVGGFSAKAPSKPEVKHATATHKASFIITRGQSFAFVEIGVRDHLQSLAGQSRIDSEE